MGTMNGMSMGGTHAEAPGATKLQRLLRALPEGLLVDSKWLERRGYTGSLRSSYVKSGWLQRPARSVFRRPRGALGWEQAAISLQALMQYPAWIGGRTALDLRGFPGIVEQSAGIHLYCRERLPAWLHALPLERHFILHSPERLLPGLEPFADRWSLDVEWSAPELLEQGFRVQPWGEWDWPLVLSAPERAYLELLDELPERETFQTADEFMRRLAGLRPRCVQRLLELSGNVKVKRLFLFFADRHRHAWIEQIDRSRVDLGRGRRIVAADGVWNAAYRITVPAEIDGAGDGI